MMETNTCRYLARNPARHYWRCLAPAKGPFVLNITAAGKRTRHYWRCPAMHKYSCCTTQTLRGVLRCLQMPERSGCSCCRKTDQALMKARVPAKSTFLYDIFPSLFLPLHRNPIILRELNRLIHNKQIARLAQSSTSTGPSELSGSRARYRVPYSAIGMRIR